MALNLSNEKDILVLPSVILYAKLTKAMHAQTIWFPDVDTSDGIAYDYAQSHKIVHCTRCVRPIISVARII